MVDISSWCGHCSVVSAAVGAASMAAASIGTVVKTKQEVTTLHKKVNHLEECKEDSIDRLARIETKIDILAAQVLNDRR